LFILHHFNLLEDLPDLFIIWNFDCYLIFHIFLSNYFYQVRMRLLVITYYLSLKSLLFITVYHIHDVIIIIINIFTWYLFTLIWYTSWLLEYELLSIFIIRYDYESISKYFKQNHFNISFLWDSYENDWCFYPYVGGEN